MLRGSESAPVQKLDQSISVKDVLNYREEIFHSNQRKKLHPAPGPEKQQSSWVLLLTLKTRLSQDQCDLIALNILLSCPESILN